MIRRAVAPLAILLFLALPVTAWASPKVAVTPVDGDTEGEVREALVEAVDADEYKLISKKETNRAVEKIGELTGLTEKDAKKLAKELSADAIISGSLEKSGAMKTLKVKLFVNGKMKKGFTVKFKNATTPKFKEAVRKKVVEKLDGTTEMAAEGEEPPPKKGGKKPPKTGEDDEDPLANVKPKNGKGEKAEKAEKPEKTEKTAKAEKTEKSGKPGKGEKTEKTEKPEKAAKAEKAEKPEKAAKAEKTEKAEKPAPDEEEEDRKPAPSEEEGKKPAPTQTAAAEEEEEEGEDDDAAITKRASPAAKGGRSANRASARVEVGPSMVKRTLEFNSNLPANLAPQPFRPRPVPGLRVEGDVYPLGFANPDSFLAGLGIAFKYDRTLKMNVQTSDQPGTDFPVEQYRYAAGVRFRVVGRSATSPSITAGFDVGRSRFRPDRTALMEGSRLDLPNTYYKFLAPGLGFRIPIGGFLAFFARGEGWLVSDAGAIVRKNSYGLARVLGIDTEGGFDIVLMKRFAVRLSGGFTQIGYQFQGKGGREANSRDGDANTRDVGGAADRLFTAAMTLAVTY